MEVDAPITKATVVNHDSALSTKKKIMAPIKMIKMEHILYYSVMNAEAPSAIIAPIS